MTANWTAPATWNVGQLVTANDLNTQLRDNLEFLKSPPSGIFTLNQGADYTTSSTSFADIDGTNISLQIATTNLAKVLIGFTANVRRSTAGTIVYFDCTLDGVRIGGDDGIVAVYDPLNQVPGTPVTFLAWAQGITPAGNHTFKMQWKVNANSATLYAGAGTASGDLHPQFWVREIS